ncbi:hypothetical protein [Oerskovia sp. KBS0722]|uniref:hypothetical protein n=1 Tax=Oerskovia sp. KBS0722 TaxID=1179673 RepID=UPI00110F2C5D|nr:hypothetical protein [Oerskovia sp. KBS0722]QDW62856.1 hypothetical protein FFI11_010175 [Oerskovia sp. KBS0722]
MSGVVAPNAAASPVSGDFVDVALDAPGVRAETSLTAAHSLTATSGGASLVADDPLSAVSIDGEPREAVSVVVGDGAVSVPSTDVGLRLRGVSRGEVEGDLLTFEGGARGPDYVVQPLDAGVRIMSILADGGQSERVQYDLSVPDGGAVLPQEDGALVVLGADGRGVGILEAPWAFDADGREVPTRYVLEGDVLTQVVSHHGKGYTYPIVADPAWSYTLDYASPAGVHGVYSGRGVNHQHARAELTRCFNCSFPISGAPKTYPKVGNLWPLKAFGQNAPVKVTAAPDRVTSWTFLAREGHFDGAGSTISFRLYSDGTRLRLAVSAHVVKDNGVVLNAFNATQAKGTWKSFLDMLNANICAQQGRCSVS